MTSFNFWPFKKTPTAGAAAKTDDQAERREHLTTLERTVAMVSDRAAQKLARHHGLRFLDLTWEDTARSKHSALGPNISDMTLQVVWDGACSKRRGWGPRSFCLPVLRYPNFTDRSCDLPLEDLSVRCGNERGDALRPVLLRDYLADLRAHLTRPSSWTGTARSLLGPRDSHVLLSAQACFLPVPARGEARFNPVLFNYQSYGGNPAVLAILATPEGTSATVIDNQRDSLSAGGAWGQRLFFNQAGQRASLTGRRLSEVRAELADRPAEQGAAPLPEAGQGHNLVMLIQVPLKQRPRPPMPAMAFCVGLPDPGSAVRRCRSADAELSDVEEAVVGHGEAEGPFTEVDDLPIERDPRFPVRVTVQLYQATSNGGVTADDLANLSAQIEGLYGDPRGAGSLVTQILTGRPTEWSP